MTLEAKNVGMAVGTTVETMNVGVVVVVVGHGAGSQSHPFGPQSVRRRGDAEKTHHTHVGGTGQHTAASANRDEDLVLPGGGLGKANLGVVGIVGVAEVVVVAVLLVAQILAVIPAIVSYVVPTCAAVPSQPLLVGSRPVLVLMIKVVVREPGSGRRLKNSSGLRRCPPV